MIDRDQPDGDPQRHQPGERVVAEAEAEGQRRRQQPATGPRRASPLGRAPADEQPHDEGRREDVEGVHVGAEGVAPWLGGEREGEPRHARGSGHGPAVAFLGQLTDDQDRQAGRAGEGRCGEEVHPPGDFADRDLAPCPADQRVRRKAGRMEDRQRGRDGLRLGGVPEAG